MRRDASESREAIVTATTGLARRMNAHALWRSTSIFALWGVGIAAVFVFVSKFVTMPIPQALVAASVVGVSLVTGVIKGLMARASALEAAVMADAKLGLKERLGSSVELLRQGGRSEMAELQLKDAADYARTLDQKAVCPRVVPVTARILPVAWVALTLFLYALSLHGRPAEVPAEVRQRIERVGAEMEVTAEEVEKVLQSDGVAKLASKMAVTGRELQDEPLTKKESLRNLSNLAREIEALKMIGEVARELAGDTTPEKKRILNESLDKLAENLRDLRGMAELSQKVLEARQADLSVEALMELATTLEQMQIGTSDANALQQMSEQVKKGKRDIGQAALVALRGAGSPDAQIEGGPGLMGDGPPGKSPAKDEEGTADHAPRQPIQPGEEYLELDGQLSEKGRMVPTEIHADAEKGESLVPYEEVYVKYRDAADGAITRTAIPWTYREHVKSYFDAIRPEEKSRRP